MVTITGYSLNINEQGKEFISLQLLSELKFEVSKTGSMYGVRRKAYLPTNLSDTEVDGLVGTTLTGDIIKVRAKPYTYKTSSGEELELSHKWVYEPDEDMEAEKPELDPQHSENGITEESLF